MSATATAASVQELDKQVNDDVLSGKAMEAFEKYYAEDVVMQENSEEPRRGKAANRKAEEEFFASVEAFNGGSVKASAVNGDVSFSEWEMDVTFGESFTISGRLAARLAVFTTSPSRIGSEPKLIPPCLVLGQETFNS